MSVTENPTPKRILIIKLRHHGDVLLSTPVARILKETYPLAQIDGLLYAETLDMLRYNDDFANLYTIDRGWKKKGVRVQLGNEIGLLMTLRHNHYDLIIHLTDSWRGALICRFCQPQKSISYAYFNRDRGLWRRSFTNLVPWSENEHMVEFHLKSLIPLGIQPQYKAPLKLQIANKDTVSVEQKLTKLGWQKQPYVLVHPAARWFFKCWDDDKMASVITRLLQQKQTVVLTGGPSEAEKLMMSQIKQLIGESDNLFDLSGQLTLSELAAAIAGAKLFFGVDSAPMHMAAALNIPGVALFGSTKVKLWRPWSNQIALIDARDFGEIPDPDSIDTTTHERYLSAIPVDRVWQAVEEKL